MQYPLRITVIVSVQILTYALVHSSYSINITSYCKSINTYTNITKNNISVYTLYYF